MRKMVSANRNLFRVVFVALGFSYVMAAAAASVDSAPTDTVKGRAPTAAPTYENTTRPGQPAIDGDTVVVTSGFDDADGDAEFNTEYVWKRDGSPIAGATAESYTLAPADIGAVLTVEVTPATDPAITDPYQASSPSIATIDTATETSDRPISVAIHKNGAPLVGNPIVGDVLQAVPTCIGTCASDLTYAWDAGSQVVGTNSANYTVTKDDQKKAIKVSVE